jgi:iron-sulfur cluster assembly 2
MIQRIRCSTIGAFIPTRLSLRSFSIVTKTQAVSLNNLNITNQGISFPKAASRSQYGLVTDDLIITQICIERIKQLASRRQDACYLRVYVDAGGCSGFQYKFDLTMDKDEPVDPNTDIVFETEGARVVVDSASLEYIKGSTVDFVQEMIKSSFAIVDNPKSESACGCGSSFALKNFKSNPAID